jgi:hypothetical protein
MKLQYSHSTVCIIVNVIYEYTISSTLCVQFLAIGLKREHGTWLFVF